MIFKKSIFIVLIIVCIFITDVYSQTLELENGYVWITNTQNQSGSWGNKDDSLNILNNEYFATFEVLETLKTLNQSGTLAYQNGILWLQSLELLNTGYIAHRINILSNSSTDITTDMNTLILYRNSDNGWGGYLNYKNNNYHTALALQALKSVNYSDQNVISSALFYLTSNQNSDGGFGFYSGADSNIYMTALVSSTLQQFPQTTSIATAINKATAYLLSKQNPDGSFSSSPSAVAETSLALIALLNGNTGQGTALPLQKAIQDAINYLESTQLANGSWDDDPYSTALALRALAMVKPNLFLSSSDITFSKPNPTIGDTITITANIKNTGPSQADNVSVHFYDNNPSSGGILIGETTIPSIPAFGSTSASITWTIPDASAHTIFVKIDPLNTIDELNETDNTASKNLTSATLPDLSITSADITISPSAPMPNTDFSIGVTIRNKGESQADNVTVSFYDSDPNAGGTLIGNLTISITPGSMAYIQQTANLPQGMHNIYVLADSANTVTESNETNNTAIKTVSVALGFTDLSIKEADITFNPEYPVEGNTVTINASVRNSGETSINNAVVRFYLGNPSAGWTQIGPDMQISSIMAGSTSSVSTQWDSTGHKGSNDISVTVDPANNISEEFESNNTAYRTIKVAAINGPDLTLASTDITFLPQSPNRGELVTISANISNIGTQDSSDIVIEFRIFDPNINSYLIIGNQTILFLAAGSSSNVQLAWDTSGYSGGYEIYANIDPANTIAEMSEINNTAHVPITVTAPQGPDIINSFIDTAGIVSDTQTLTITGSVNVTIKNKGTLDTLAPFVLTAFEDRNNNRIYEPGTDVIFGQTTYSNNLPAGSEDTIPMSISGTVVKIDSPLYLMADSGNVVVEIEEENNINCLAIFTACRNVKVDKAIKTGASWLIDHQLNVDTQGTMKAWGSTSIWYNAIAVKAYQSTGKTTGTKYSDVLDRLTNLQAPDGSWDESIGTTTETIIALLEKGFSPSSREITEAVSWLKRVQGTDWSWGDDINSTGMAVTALIKAGEDKNAPFIQEAVNWLLQQRNSYGYWGVTSPNTVGCWTDSYPLIAIALATSPTRPEVIQAKNWYTGVCVVNISTFLRNWLRMMAEIDPNNSNVASVISLVQSTQLVDGGWNVISVYPNSDFVITADISYLLGRFGKSGTSVDRSVQWIDNHVNDLDEGYSAEKSIMVTGYALDALQAADIRDTANLSAITTGRNAIVFHQYAKGSWDTQIPIRPSGFADYIYSTAASIFMLSYSDNISATEQTSVNKGINYLIQIQNADGGWPSYKYLPTDLYSSEFALMSLLQAGLTPTHQTVSKGLSYLNSKQNSDGGFGSTENTAYAAITYKLAGSAYQSRLDQTISWLKARQHPDGGWGTMLEYSSTTTSTSWALIALSYAEESGIEVARGVSWLLAAQNHDRGWGAVMGVPMSSEYDTAHAVWALSLSRFFVGFNIDLSMDRQDYCPNDIVSITAVSDKPASDISLSGTVTLQEGGSYPLSFVLSGNVFNADFAVPETALPGTATVHLIGTSDYGYGVATTKFRIKNCASLKTDLAIDISATADDPQNMDSRTLSAIVRNQGPISANNVEIKFYKGSLSLGDPIYSEVIANIPASGSYSITFPIIISEDTLIIVQADPDDLIQENDETNNIASILLTRTIPDLSISSSDLTIIPPVIEGQSSNITAIIHNIGNLGASDVVVSFYDGDPLSGGVLIGSQTKSFIDAGATALAQITWNTFGQSGTNYIHVVVDPQNLITEANENNNATLIAVDVAAPSKPDLAITSSDITFSNLNPQEGEPLVITATVHNLGTDASDIKMNLYDGNPSSGGTLVSTKTIQQMILFGGQTAITFTLDTVGLSGNHEFHLILDPDNTIDETNETNNSAWNSLTIGPSGLSLSVSTDKTTYTSAEDVLITANATDLTGTARTGTLEVRITDLSSNVVSTVSSQTVTLGPNENMTLNYTWNTGQTLSGDYKVYAVFVENGNITAKADTPISILKDMNISSKVTTDKTSYSPNQPVTLTSTITSGSTNYIFEDLTATITISDQLSAISLHTETQTISVLMPGQLTEFKTYWNTSTNPTGTYPVVLEVRDASNSILSTSTTNIIISNEIKPSKLLKGQISVDKQSILQGEPENITYSITNVGNTDLSQVDLSVLTVHVVNLNVYDTLTDLTALSMGSTYANTKKLSTSSYSAKDYLVILRANISGKEESLASTYFRVEGAPSAPSLNAPAHQADVETLTPLLIVNNASDPNDDKLTYEFEIYSDPGLANLIVLSGVIAEGTNTTLWQTPLELIENSVYYWRARAYDGLLYGEWMVPASFRVNLENEPPTAPTLSSPAQNSSVDTLTPLLTVNNASDPDSENLTYNFILASDPELTQNVSSETGIFEGNGTTSWHPSTSSGQTLTLNENTWYYWSSQADDWLITGPWMATASFFVNTTNDAPSVPVIISPANNAEITALFADIIVSNSTDPDSIDLTYIFEADTSASFDSSAKMTSANIPEGQGTTSWLADNLNDNTFYYVRAKATDGLAESDWSEVIGFFINTANDAPSVPALANPSNGSGVNSFNPALSVHNSTDIDGDILTYEFELYSDPAMTVLLAGEANIEEAQQVTAWIVTLTLEENKTYYWRARAYDGELYSGWMPVASFMVNTANDAPSAPILYSPAEGVSLDILDPTLSVYNALDPDSDSLVYDFEIYSGGILARTIKGIPENNSGITSAVLTPLSDNTEYTWRARAYDGDRYGAWMDIAAFSIHMPSTNITATIDFDPNTLNQKSKGNWVTVYIELPAGYNLADINISSLLLNGTVNAEIWPYAIGDNDKDGISDLMVKFNRDAVINILPNGDNIQVKVTGTVGTTTFEGVDRIRVIK